MHARLPMPNLLGGKQPASAVQAALIQASRPWLEPRAVYMQDHEEHVLLLTFLSCCLQFGFIGFGFLLPSVAWSFYSSAREYIKSRERKERRDRK